MPPWNWCKICQQLVDLPQPCFDGTEVDCRGCGIVYVATEFEDMGFSLLPAIEVELEDDDGEIPPSQSKAN